MCIVTATNTKCFVYQTLHVFLMAFKVIYQVDPSLPSFPVVFIHYWSCSRPEYNWNTSRWILSNSQSINQNYKNIKNLLEVNVVTYFFIQIHRNQSNLYTLIRKMCLFLLNKTGALFKECVWASKMNMCYK